MKQVYNRFAHLDIGNSKLFGIWLLEFSLIFGSPLYIGISAVIVNGLKIF
jgi:hypothetical protein